MRLANIKNNTFVVACVFPICFIWFSFCFTLFFPMTTFWRMCKDFWTKINSNTIASNWVIFALPGAYCMQRLAKLIWCPLPSLLDCIIWPTLILGDKENDMKKKMAFHVYWNSSMWCSASDSLGRVQSKGWFLKIYKTSQCSGNKSRPHNIWSY